MPKIILFGATGYTGHLVAETLVLRGLTPVLAARNEERLVDLSQRLGGLDYFVADVEQPASLRGSLEKGDVLVSAVGPYVRFGKPALDAVVEKSAHYIDCAAEPSFIRQVYQVYDEVARFDGIGLLTAFGFEYVPGTLAGAAALERAGPTATRVDIGYFVTGDDRLEISEGARYSLAATMLDAGVMLAGGEYVEGYGGTGFRKFRVMGESRPAISIPSSEHLNLPRFYPRLRDINVYTGAYGQYGYLLRQVAKVQTVLSQLPGYRSGLDMVLPSFLKSEGKGPDALGRARSGSLIQALAYDEGGSLLAKAEMRGINPYTFTANMMAWAAEAVLQDKLRGAGALGPIGAFGLDEALSGCASAGIKLI